MPPSGLMRAPWPMGLRDKEEETRGRSTPRKTSTSRCYGQSSGTRALVEWRLAREAAPALDQRVIEDRFVVVLARDHHKLVPDAWIDDPLAVDLSSEMFLVNPRKRVAGSIHTPSPVAPTDDRDELTCLLVVVGCHELGQRLLRGSTAQESDDVFPVSPPLLLPNGLAEPDMHSAFGARRAHEDAVARVVIALLRPLIRLALPLPYDTPILRKIRGLPPT